MKSEVSRRDLLKSSFAAIGFAALPGGFLFAAPRGWKHEGKPNLVFGVLSDTHLRTMHGSSGRPGRNWPHKYFAAALEYFKKQNVDAVVHCGDFAHRGQVEEMRFHADVWRNVFGGEGPVKLFVTGNHDVLGAEYGDFAKGNYPDPEERAKHVLATDMAANWECIWGEKYESVWHKEVNGYHFFGRHWNVDYKDFAGLVNSSAAQCGLGEGTRPYFVLQHRRPYAELRKALSAHGNAVSFFGHNHWSASNWNVISLYGAFPCIQCPSCEPRGCAALTWDGYISKVPLEGRGPEKVGAGRQGFVVSLYDDMMVIARYDFTDGVSSLGADWVMPLNWGTGNGERGTGKHPFSKDELKMVIGEPQFHKGAKLEVSLDRIDKINKIEKTANDNPVTPVNPVQENPASPKLCVRIPLADGNPDSRVYAYEVVVIGEAGSQKLFKAVYAAGCNMGIGHETNGGVTTLEIAKDELPPGKSLTFAVRPLTSLGTSGRPIITDFKV